MKKKLILQRMLIRKKDRQLLSARGCLLVIMAASTALLSGCQSFSLEHIQTEENRELLRRGKTVLESEQEDVSVEASAVHGDSELEFTLFIDNNSDEDIFFHDGDVVISQGNYKTGKWRPLTYYSAEEYYDKTKESLDTETALIIVGNILGSLDDGNIKTSASITYYDTEGPSYSVDYTERTYSQHLAYLERLKRTREVNEYLRNKKAYLKMLEETLLFPSDIPSERTYWGIVYSEIGKGPDYRLSLKLEDRNYSFIFARSDRDEVLNPLKDKDRPQGTIYYPFRKDKPAGIGLSFNHHKSFGFFTQVNFDNPDFADYEIADAEYTLSAGTPDLPTGYILNNEADPVTLHVEPVLGINSKVAAYVWLNGGLGMEISKTYRLAEFDDSEDGEADTSTVWLGEDSSDLAFHPQAGLRLIVGNLTLGASMIMDGLDPETLFENPEFSLQGGIAF